MSGRRHEMDSLGGTYEDCARLLIGRIANLVQVPRERDYGIDFFCEPRVPAGQRSETVVGLSGLQVKGGGQTLTYGGLNQRDEWKEYELRWVNSQASPLYLVGVDAACSAVDLYSLWPLWWIFWQQTALPFEVVFVTEPGGKSSWRYPVAAPRLEGAGSGDGNRWEVYLGPPFLHLTVENVNDAAFRQQAKAILGTRIVYDRTMLMRYLQFVPALDGITGWETNSVQPTEVRSHQFWSSTPGVNIARLCLNAEPMFVNLGIHLQHQKNPAAYKLIPLLEWLDEQHFLGVFGKGLLDVLRSTPVAASSEAAQAVKNGPIDPAE